MFLGLNLEDWRNLATIVAATIAAVSLWSGARQLRKNALTNHGQFLLELEKMSQNHDEVHNKLRPGGEWDDGISGPEASDEWSRLEDYLGFFEICEILIQDGSISEDKFKVLFEYRLSNIVSNQTIVTAKLVNEREDWKTFSKLLERFDLQSSQVNIVSRT